MSEAAHLRPQHGGRVSDGEHDLVDQLHGDVAHDTEPLGILQGQVLRKLPLLTCWEGWQGLRWTAREVRGGLNESQRSGVKHPPGMGSAPPESRLKELLLPPPMVGLKMGALGTTAALTVAESERNQGMGGSEVVVSPQKGSPDTLMHVPTAAICSASSPGEG